MYQDTVAEPKKLHDPRFLVLLFVGLLGLAFFIDFSQSLVGQLLTFVTGPVEESGLYGRFASAFLVAFIMIVNLFAISFLPFRYQVAIVWAQLLCLALAFFYGFDLNIEFIQTKIWFMVSKGLATTLYISAISIFFATLLALVGAVAKLSNNGFAFAIASFYTSFFRGLPLLMQLYLIYLGLPQLGFVIDAIPAGILALSLCYGAYMTEIFRAGIQSIPQGQWEGARALGFNFRKVMRYIILPQSIPLIIPPTGNQFIAMLKDSTLVSVIGVIELMFLARTLGNKQFKHMEMLITAALIYWLMSIVLELIQARIERHYRKSTTR